MRFALRPDEGVQEGLRRLLGRQLDSAIERLAGDGDPDEVVAETRRTIKRLRALLRPAIGDEGYRRENGVLRDAARALSAARDARALIDAVDVLGEVADAAPGEGEPALRAALRREADEALRTDEHRRALAAASRALAGVRERMAAWPPRADGWAGLEPGLRRCYRRGRRALARAETARSAASLHEWRKRAKRLWHQLQLIEPALGSGAEVERLRALGRSLGDAQDLAMLRARLRRDPSVIGDQRSLRALIARLDLRRRGLEADAFALGRALYAEKPSAFVGRIERRFTAWWAPETRALSGVEIATGRTPRRG